MFRPFLDFQARRALRTPRRDPARAPAAGLVIAAFGWGLAGPGVDARAAAAAAATLDGVVAVADGSGARITLLISGVIHYVVAPHGNRIVVNVEGLAAGAATYHVSAGPVRGVEVRPATDGRSTDVLITTREPMEVAESFLARQALVVRLAPPAAVRGTPNVPAGTSPAPSGSRPGSAATSPAAASPVRLLIRLEAGSGQVVRIDRLMRVAVSDPQVLGAMPVTSRELLVTGRMPGRTTMYVWEGAGRMLSYAVEVLPGVDRAAALRRLLEALFPRAEITVTEAPPGSPAASPLPPASASSTSPAALPPAAPVPPGFSPPSPLPAVPGSQGPPVFTPRQVGMTAGPQAYAAGGSAIVLSGAVETQIDRQKAEEVARAFASTVVNLLDVRHPIQLKLQITVVELSRTGLRTLGVNWGGGQQTSGAAPSLNGGVYNLQLLTSPGAGTAGLDLLIAQIQALAQQGQARLLAQPSLVVLAGRSASLLLGGQVPIPVAGPNGTVTIEYRDFGVILNARPDYQDDGRVFMQISPEVSTLDFANAIKVSGFTIPALRVRRAQTVVSMRPAQTLVVGGLLQQQDSELVQRVPVLGDLPIIGPLFRSTTFQRQDSDLVIFVTPILAEPGGAPTPASITPNKEVVP